MITRTIWKKISLVFLILILSVIFVAEKIRYFAANPVGEKDCPPLYPSSLDPFKPTKIQIPDPYGNLNWAQKGGTINDASCLDKTAVYGIVKVQTEDDIRQALIFAQDKKLKISIAGIRHSMGGQAFAKDALILDMTAFNTKILNEQKKTMTVQSGATWHDIQKFLHPKYAVKAMQSTDIFTVGGSISVNAHGMDHQIGSLSNTIRSLKIMKADGKIEILSPTQNPELYRLVIGGYGLFGIILEAEIDITENVVYQSERQIIDYKNFPSVFNNQILPDPSYGLMYSHLSTSPSSLLREMILYTYKQVDEPDVSIPPIEEVTSIKLRRFVFNFSKLGSIPMRIKWFMEKNIEPKIESCTIVSRNQALGEGEACLVTRNEPMHDSVPYLKNNLKNDTDILHEYFIPRSAFENFVDSLRTIVQENDVNLLNASVRVVHKEDIFLNYAPEDMYSLVLYINQKTDLAANDKMKKVTSLLIDLTNSVGGRFFLPYQLHYTPEQLQQSYPQIAEFFQLKKKYDPNETLTSTFYEKYSPAFVD